MRKREIKLSVYLNHDEWKMLTFKVRSLIEGFEQKENHQKNFMKTKFNKKNWKCIKSS